MAEAKLTPENRITNFDDAEVPMVSTVTPGAPLAIGRCVSFRRTQQTGNAPREKRLQQNGG
jgi:hypothetical protein